MLSLCKYHTFQLEINAIDIIEFQELDTLLKQVKRASFVNLPIVVLGAGSNVLFVEDFEGVVLINKLEGVEITENTDNFFIEAKAGENWHNLVEFALKNKIYGLENLALIPGTVGAAPVQNIGAYGVEFADFCDFVEGVDLETGQIKRFYKEECRFGYRNSIFKEELKNNFVITKVGLKLSKNIELKTNYGELVTLKEPCTPENVFDLVCKIRQEKLPNPDKYGNAGSFFKNPVISQEKGEKLKLKYPQMPYFEQKEGYKIPAGWLIENSGLNDYIVGGASIYEKHKLILINKDKAKACEVVKLASKVQKKVKEKFHITLEPEVRFIGKKGEIDATKFLENYDC